jgi:large subunit ribosomal protein L6
MIDAHKLKKEIVIPEGVEATLEEGILTVKKGSNEVKRDLYYPTIEVLKEGQNIVLNPKKFSKREKKMINTYTAHIKGMLEGVSNPFVYKVKICSSHFPMNVSTKNNKVIIKNFFGEKIPREAVIVEGVNLKIEGDVIVITSSSKEAAGQTAANCEKATKITNRDRRVFQDGLWIIEKAGKEL